MAVVVHKVLIVEDDRGMREAIERLLGAADFDAVAYASAEELLAEAATPGASCIVSDLKLPGISGLELLDRLRARCWRAPLILITAYDAPGMGDEALRRGAADYLVKPFHGTTLLAAIRTAIEALGGES